MRIIHTNGSVLLVMDRTNWKWGQKDINFLFLAVAWEGIAVPLFWSLLASSGKFLAKSPHHACAP
ncbi:MAG: hypothetical protein K2P90_01380, partial [Holosporales bacterium]|nr:hypothetical protein [Holosporales bacterium]